MGKALNTRHIELTRTQATLLLIAVIANMLVLASYTPLMVVAGVVMLLLWRVQQIRHALAGPPRTVLLGLLALFAWVVAMTTPGPWSVERGAILAPVVVALKLLETRSRRDAFVAVLLTSFLPLATFLFAQTMSTALVGMAGMTLGLGVLVTLNAPQLSIGVQVRTAALMVGQALPFMVVLFVLFPRNLMPFWTLPSSMLRTSTGLKEWMAPGSISNLTLSGETAFRVRFSGSAPPAQQLYWRGPVMTEFDGRTWRGLPVRTGALPEVENGQPVVDYEVTLEPSNNAWLLALDTPLSLPSGALFTRDLQLISRSPVRNRMRYSGQSALFLAVGQDSSEDELAPARALPALGNPRARELAEKLRAENPYDSALIQAALSYFSRGGFVYTLNPPRLGIHGIDDFLFETRRGFCEHFASAFVFMMRAAGLPARVVTGYQGGDMNPIDGYLVVRQADAHAWAEVWLPGEGWRRVDPTAAAAPARVIAGLPPALPEGEALPLALRQDIPWLREFRHRMDAITNGWNQWVLGYNTQSQQKLLSRFGIKSPDWRTLATASTLLVGVFMTVLALWAAWPRRHRNRAQRAWAALVARLARAGLPQHAWEGPVDYAARIGQAREDLKKRMYDIAQVYAQLRYGPAPSREALHQLNRLIREFKP